MTSIRSSAISPDADTCQSEWIWSDDDYFAAKRNASDVEKAAGDHRESTGVADGTINPQLIDNIQTKAWFENGHAAR